jgi:hypothetical protein
VLESAMGIKLKEKPLWKLILSCKELKTLLLMHLGTSIREQASIVNHYNELTAYSK